eukprot:04896_5
MVIPHRENEDTQAIKDAQRECKMWSTILMVVSWWYKTGCFCWRVTKSLNPNPLVCPNTYIHFLHVQSLINIYPSFIRDKNALV